MTASDELRTILRQTAKDIMTPKEAPLPEKRDVIIKYRKKKEEPKEQEKEYAEVTMQPEAPTDDVSSGLYDFFELTPWTATSEKKQKLDLMVDFIKEDKKVKSRADVYKYLTNVSRRMGIKDYFESSIDRLYKYFKVRMSLRDMEAKKDAMER